MKNDIDSRIVVGIGEALWDVLPDGKKIGGAPANFAYHVSQNGLKSCVASAIGNDLNGVELIQQFNYRKLNFLMPVTDYQTGTVVVNVDELGIPTYDIKENVAWDNIPYSNELADLADRSIAVCFGSLAQRNIVSRTTIQRFLRQVPDDALKVFDINLRQGFYSPETIEESFRLCNILKINDEELVLISRMFGYPGIDLQDKCRNILGQYNLKMLILTCGINGSYVFDRGRVSFIDTPKVEVADTVGAGDSFTAAFISSILKGRTVEESHRLAVDTSAYVCTQHGAMPILPDCLSDSL